jgi:hypothetical protein
MIEQTLNCNPEANPTIVSYHASVIKIYSATNTIGSAILEYKLFFSDVKAL